MSELEGGGRKALPWVMAALVLVIGGAKLDAARPLVGRALAVAAPIIPVVLGAARIESAAPPIERMAVVTGWLTVLIGEVCVAAGFFGVSWLAGAAAVLRWALLPLVAVAIAAEYFDRRRGGKSRFGAYVALSAGFAAYLSTHTHAAAFFAVFGAFFAALLAGAAALLLGELLARVLPDS